MDLPLVACVKEEQAAVGDEHLRKIKTVNSLDLTIPPLEPTLRLHPLKFLQIERPESTYTGGFDTNVTVERFVGRKYGDLVIAQTLEPKDDLGISPQDMDFRTMWATVHEYYSMSFREQTGMLQPVMAEFRLSRHMHGGRL